MLKTITARHIRMKTRKRIIKAYVWSTLLYGCDTWTITTRNMTKLQSFEMWAPLNNVSEQDILKEFNDVISVDDNSLGTLPGTAHFTTDVTVEPKVVSPKRVPVGLKEKLKLENLVKNGVIKEVDEPTDWVSQMTITLKKKNDIIICLDPQALNRALKREVYHLPAIDDVLPELGNAKVFTKVYKVATGT